MKDHTLYIGSKDGDQRKVGRVLRIIIDEKFKMSAEECQPFKGDMEKVTSAFKHASVGMVAACAEISAVIEMMRVAEIEGLLKAIAIPQQPFILPPHLLKTPEHKTVANAVAREFNFSGVVPTAELDQLTKSLQPIDPPLNRAEKRARRRGNKKSRRPCPMHYCNGTGPSGGSCSSCGSPTTF